MTEKSYFLGVDFGHANTRCSILLETDGKVRIFDMFEIDGYKSIAKDENPYEQIIAGVADYLKTKKLVLKSITSNLCCDYFNHAKSFSEKTRLLPFRKINVSNVRRCRKSSAKFKVKPDEQPLDVAFHKYFIDGNHVLRPVGLKGKKLRVETTQFVTKTSEYLKLQKAVLQSGYILEGVIPSHVSYQSFLEKLEITTNQHILLIDFGKKETKVTVSNLHQVLAIANFKIGGDDFTKIISDELRIDISEGEKIKCAGLHPVFMEDYHFEASVIQKLARRLKSEVYVLFQTINHYLKSNGFDERSLGKIVLAGGGSKFMGIKEIAQSFFNTDCCNFGDGELKYQMNLYVKPEYYCSLGLAIGSFNKRHQLATKGIKKFSFAKYLNDSASRLLFSD